MIVTLVALLCNTLAGPPLCVEEIVGDATSLQACQLGGAIGIAQWMAGSVKYRANWRLDRFTCVPGKYQIRGRA